MHRVPVSSSNLQSVGYDAATKTLEIRFDSGGIYQYLNVPPSTHQGLMSAASKGTFFDAWIKHRYATRRVG